MIEEKKNWELFETKIIEREQNFSIMIEQAKINNDNLIKKNNKLLLKIFQLKLFIDKNLHSD